MLILAKIKEKETNFDYTITSRGGGFVSYFNLTKSLYLNFYKNRTLFSVKAQCKLFSLMILKTPWWVVIKPMGVVFSTKKRFLGTLKVRYKNDEFLDSYYINPKKVTTLSFFGIPFFYFKRSGFSKTDRAMLMKKYGRA